jgi:hypothetical protein
MCVLLSDGDIVTVDVDVKDTVEEHELGFDTLALVVRERLSVVDGEWLSEGVFDIVLVNERDA